MNLNSYGKNSGCCPLKTTSFIVFWFCLFTQPNISTAQTFTAIPATTEIKLIGFTRPATVMKIFSEVNGRCLAVKADKGMPIPADGSFAQIDNTFILLDIETNKLNSQQADKNLQFATQEVNRYTRLVATNSSSQIKLDELILRQKQAKTRLNLLKTETKRLNETLSRHDITAPADWLVLERKIEPGEWVRTGQLLARIGNFKQLVIPVALTPEELVSLQQINNKIPLLFLDTGNRGQGTLGNISPDFDPTTRKITAEIRVNMDIVPQEFARQGGTRVQISLKVADPMGGFLVPEKAITLRYEEHWLTRKNGAALRVIVLGSATNSTNSQQKWLRITSPEIQKDDLFILPEPQKINETIPLKINQ